jgi:hypothetical protein
MYGGLPDGLNVATTPTVMLSPKARNLVFEIVAIRPTLTGKTHEAERFSESVAVQDTSVDPSAKVDPDGGAQLTATGDCPPSASGVGYVTATPLADVLVEIGDGHDNVGAAGGGGVTTGGGVVVGAVGVLLVQSAAARSARKQTAYRSNVISCQKPSDAIPVGAPTHGALH